jgi:cytochrome c oxidase subunit 2
MSRVRLPSVAVLLACLIPACCRAESSSAFVNTNIFEPVSTPARDVHQLSLFVLLITGGIFLGVSGLILFAIIRFRCRPGETAEPPQVFGSTQIELAWTIIPVLLITVLFLGTARVIFAIQDAPEPKSAVEVLVVGHQFWWEFRYPQYGVVTANELHVPESTDQQRRPTYLKLTSADVMHSFWVPRLAGKTDLLPNRVNEMWFDPHETGLFKGQCAQFCGPEHAKMLLRVYVDSPAQFDAWIRAQQKTQSDGPATAQGGQANAPAATPVRLNAAAVNVSQSAEPPDVATGRQVFEQQACINCHTVRGTIANGRYGPDLTHLMSRETIGAGIVPNTRESLLRWINDPNDLKPGCLMPAMHLTDQQNAQITAYLLTLH